MNLAELRSDLSLATGRMDFLTTNEAFATRLLNAGVRHLDGKMMPKASRRTYDVVLPTGLFFLRFPLCRAIKGVYLTETDGQTRLTKASIEELRQRYWPVLREAWTGVQKTIATENLGTPLYYCPVAGFPAPSQNVIVDGAFGARLGHETAVPGNAHDLTSIVVLPAPDQDLWLTVEGWFYSEKLVDDGDTNFWTVNHPELVIAAAGYVMEMVFYRNREGAAAYAQAVAKRAREIDMDSVEQDITDISQIGG